MSGSTRMVGNNGPTLAREAPPDFVIKYEPPDSDTPRPIEHSVREELVFGGEDAAIAAVQRLVESGRTTPGRVRIYANLNPIIQTSVSFPPSAPRAR